MSENIHHNNKDHHHRHGNAEEEGRKRAESHIHLSAQLDNINEEFRQRLDFKDPDELEVLLKTYKDMFLRFDDDLSGDIDEVDLSRMLEKIGHPKNIMEVRKMIVEVDTTKSGKISYIDFLDMMFGAKSTVLKLILMYEEKIKKESETPSRGEAPPPRRPLQSLP